MEPEKTQNNSSDNESESENYDNWTIDKKIQNSLNILEDRIDSINNKLEKLQNVIVTEFEQSNYYNKLYFSRIEQSGENNDKLNKIKEIVDEYSMKKKILNF